jgi:Winged helix-turn helix
MAKRVTVQTDLTTEELHERYRSATNPVERTHWHILWQMKEGHTPNEIASMLGYTARWVRTIVQRFNQAGEQGIRDHRLTLPGARCLLTVEHQKELDHTLDQLPADGGLWSGAIRGSLDGRASGTTSGPSPRLGLLAAARQKHACATPAA